MRFIFILIAALAQCACGTMQIGERSFIRPDSKEQAADTRLDAALLVPQAKVVEEEVRTPDGAVLRGLTLRRPGATRALLYFGGNAFHLDRQGRQLLPQLAACGIDVAVFDYRGYGRSSGTPTAATMAADAVRLFDHVSASYPGGVIVHGHSLGSFMAVQVAHDRPGARGVVLEATSTTVQDWVDANVPWYMRLFLKVEVAESLRGIDNVAMAARYAGAALVLAGGQDNVTPASHGRKVFAAFPGAANAFYLAPKAGHDGILGEDGVSALYCDFLGQK